jgi:glycosyltransferase involved in cell wall biosynthesis
VQASVIVPAHNEEPAIADVVKRCLRADSRIVETIVVDDGSTDATSDRAREAGAIVLRLSPNRGKGSAMRHGIEHSKGDVLVFIDADGQDDPAEISLLLDAMAPDVALVNGSRYIGTFKEGAITTVNKVGTSGLTWIVNLLFGARVTDCLAGFRAVRRAALDEVDVSANGYDIEVDMLLRIVKSGGRVVEVPATRSARAHGTSGLSNVPDGVRILWRILKIRFERA